jgi:hypothetical protein
MKGKGKTLILLRSNLSYEDDFSQLVDYNRGVKKEVGVGIQRHQNVEINLK